MYLFHLSVEILKIFIFCWFLGRERSDFFFFATFEDQNLAKNGNFQNSFSQMEDLRKIMPQTYSQAN